MSEEINILSFKDQGDDTTRQEWFHRRLIESLGSYAIPTISFVSLAEITYPAADEEGQPDKWLTTTPHRMSCFPLASPIGKLDWTVVDVGANVGTFSWMAGQLAENIISIEPCRNTYDEMYLNLSEAYGEQFSGRFTTLQKAVGSSSGKKVYMHHAPSEQSGDARSSDTPGGEEVETICLADILPMTKKGVINYLKVDCEGAEYDFLIGADLSKVGYIEVEVHSPPNGDESLRERLKSHLRPTHFLEVKEVEGELTYISAFHRNWLSSPWPFIIGDLQYRQLYPEDIKYPIYDWESLKTTSEIKDFLHYPLYEGSTGENNEND